MGLALALALMLTCQPGLADTQKPKPRPDPATLQTEPDSPAGIYLAARLASAQNDIAAAVDLYARALALDPGNPALLDGAVTARLSAGDLDGAATAARALLALHGKGQSAILAVVAADAKAGQYAAIPADLAAGNSIGEMTDGLLLAWAELGQGSMTDALASFDKLSANGAMQGFAQYHKALALALTGDFDGALKILSGPDIGKVRLSRRALIARIEVLAQLDRRPEALDLMNRAFPPGQDAVMDALRTKLSGTAPVPFDVVTSPMDGVAEVFFDMAGALTGQADDAYVLLFARTAASLRPDHVEAVMLSGELLQRLGQLDLAAQTYALIPPTSPAFVNAQIGRARAAQQEGQNDAAVTILQDLAKAHPDDAGVAQSLADILRRQSRFAEAAAEYDIAIKLTGTPGPFDWPLFYARAISLSELNRWPEAEADFKKALDLDPNQPQVLNYLGYSYVDRGENLDEALKMIQHAVLEAPDQGYIVDSLGWALYRLGRFQEAVVPMERASMLLPVDPVVTDHLGDVYWAVGRKMEARFQWRRALSFHPTEADAARITRKLDVGLDAVLTEEKATGTATGTAAGTAPALAPATASAPATAPAPAAAPAPAPAPAPADNGG
jgi:Flp pilus assembly protein TadD